MLDFNNLIIKYNCVQIAIECKRILNWDEDVSCFVPHRI